jgi:hypothetical protein
MDIQQPPRGANLDSPAMQRFLQDAYNGVKCPTFHVYVAESYNTFGYNFGGAAWNQVNFAGITHNELGGWDASRGVFNPKVPGYYYISLKLNIQIYVDHASGNPFYVGLLLNRNGAGVLNVDQSFWYSNVANNSQYEMISMHSHWLGYLNGKDDYIYGGYFNGLTANNAEIAIFGGFYHSKMQGFKITY